MGGFEDVRVTIQEFRGRISGLVATIRFFQRRYGHPLVMEEDTPRWYVHRRAEVNRLRSRAILEQGASVPRAIHDEVEDSHMSSDP